MAGLLLANVAGAQAPQSHDKWREQQEKFNKRIESSNRRATRSICADLCREQRRPTSPEFDEMFEPSSTAATSYERARTPYEIQLDEMQRMSEVVPGEEPDDTGNPGVVP